ncbi:MAG: TIGR00725 family protein [Patescibacteria group bacterium]
MKKIKRRLQIGVMGSDADLNYSADLEKRAFAVGLEIARSGNILVYGAEKDGDSLSTAAARGAKSTGGLTVGVTYGRGKDIWDKDGNTDIVIASGLERGGGREFVLVNSCDAIIILAGGSGTLSEAAIAYQLAIPIVALEGSGGWADKLADTYLDNRRRLRIIGATDPAAAVRLAIFLTLKSKIAII